MPERDAGQPSDTSFFIGAERCDAWLWAPSGPGPHPAVVLAHGSVCIKEAGLRPYGEAFASAGYSVVAFSYRNCGKSDGVPRELSSLRRMRQDVRAAIAYARSLPDVDADRVVLWGTSMGSGHVATIAAEDQRLAAAIVQCPVFDGLVLARTYGLRNVLSLTPDILADGLRRLFRRSPHYIRMVGRPGEKAIMSRPGHYEQVQRLLDAPDVFANRMSAWVLAEVVTERPAMRAPKILAPFLVCAVDREDITDVESTVRAARSAPKGEVRRYDSDHFDLYFGELNHQVISDQVEFLQRHVPPRTRPCADAQVAV
ncbi:MAG: alpha/beta hydrolase [Solirubrobacteraceae bacterium]